MRRIVLLLAVTSCGAPAAVAVAPAAQREPPVVSEPAEAPVVPITPIDAPDCEAVRFPSAGASVVTIPGETMTRALMPVVHAACACTRSGERVRLTAVITPEAGLVTAVAHDNAAADACVQRTLVGHFAPPFALGTDCIDCGPKRYAIFHGAPAPAPPKPAASRITYTLVHP
jgi:hypothetical protein